MANRSPADLIDAYRRRQQRRFHFTFADISTALLFLLILTSSVYITVTGRPELPVLVDLKTNTPTFTPSITPTASQTTTVTLTPTESPDPKYQCSCPSPIVLVVTATFEATSSPVSIPAGTATAMNVPIFTLPPSSTPTITETPLPSPTAIVYTVQRNDTLSSIALRFGVSVEAIQALNNLSTTMIYVGQVLQIPAR